MRTHFQLFVYGTLRTGGKSAELLQAAERLGTGHVGGVLYNIDGEYPALVLYGNTPIEGEIWRCPNEVLARLDKYEGVPDGLFRRIGVNVQHSTTKEIVACWAYVAGPALSRKLLPAARVDSWPVRR